MESLECAVDEHWEHHVEDDEDVTMAELKEMKWCLRVALGRVTEECGTVGDLVVRCERTRTNLDRGTSHVWYLRPYAAPKIKEVIHEYATQVIASIDSLCSVFQLNEGTTFDYTGREATYTTSTIHEFHLNDDDAPADTTFYLQATVIDRY